MLKVREVTLPPGFSPWLFEGQIIQFFFTSHPKKMSYLGIRPPNLVAKSPTLQSARTFSFLFLCKSFLTITFIKWHHKKGQFSRSTASFPWHHGRQAAFVWELQTSRLLKFRLCCLDCSGVTEGTRGSGGRAPWLFWDGKKALWRELIHQKGAFFDLCLPVLILELGREGRAELVIKGCADTPPHSAAPSRCSCSALCCIFPAFWTLLSTHQRDFLCFQWENTLLLPFPSPWRNSAQPFLLLQPDPTDSIRCRFPLPDSPAGYPTHILTFLGHLLFKKVLKGSFHSIHRYLLFFILFKWERIWNLFVFPGFPHPCPLSLINPIIVWLHPACECSRDFPQNSLCATGESWEQTPSLNREKIPDFWGQNIHESILRALKNK